MALNCLSMPGLANTSGWWIGGGGVLLESKALPCLGLVWAIRIARRTGFL